jgi:hypothetical protein
VPIGELAEGGGYDVWRGGARFALQGFKHDTTYEARSAFFRSLHLDPTGVEAMTVYASGPKGRKVSLVWSRAGEDVAVCQFTILNLTGGVPDETWITSDYTSAEARLTTFWNAIKNTYASLSASADAPVLSRFVWHIVGAGVGRPNPSERELAVSLPGTAVQNMMPPQVAVSLTLKTAVRRSWGRVYLPSPSFNTIGTAGKIDASIVTQYRDALGTMADGLKADGLPLCVFRARKAGALLGTEIIGGHRHTEIPDSTSSYLSVDQIQVDDLYDVIRGRRFDRATTKLTHTVV